MSPLAARHGHLLEHHSTARQVSRVMAVLFMIGSACFAIGAVPGYASAVSASTVGITFFVGSVFFTTAGYLELVLASNRPDEDAPVEQWRPLRVKVRSTDWWACAVQSVGTLWFNINTWNAFHTASSARQQNLHVWAPDLFGSICFLVASWLAMRVTSDHPWRPQRGNREWTIAALNMIGSIFFMASALAAFVVPSTGTLLDATLANSGTFLGAVCFFWAAALVLRAEEETPAPST